MIVDVGIPLMSVQQTERFKQDIISLLGAPSITNSIMGFLEMRFLVSKDKIKSDTADRITNIFKEAGFPKIIFGDVSTNNAYIIVSEV